MKDIIKIVIVVIIVILVFRHCENEKKDMLKSIDETNKLVRGFKKEHEAFKKTYKFDVDSLGKTIYNIKPNIQVHNISFPVIFYASENDEIVFSGLNRTIDKKLITRYIDSLGSIILVEKYKVSAGTYSDNLTNGLKWNTKIIFIDKTSKKQVASVELEGGNPPQTIKYSRKSGNTYDRTGPAVSDTQIINEIKKIIKNSR